MANMQGQDWNPVILSKRRPGAKETQTPAVCREEREERGREEVPRPAERRRFFFVLFLTTPAPLLLLSNLQALQAALRAGQVEAVKKHGGANKAHGAAGATKDAAKLDRETEELSHER